MKLSTTLLAMASIWTSFVQVAHSEEAVIVTGGSATEHDQTIVEAAAEAATRDDGWIVRSKPLTKRETESLLHCQDSGSPWTCVPVSLHASGTYHALVLAVDSRQADSGAPMIVVTGKVIATDTRAFVGKQRYCVQCADDKLAAAATALTLELLRDITVREGHTIIEVHSIPEGAQISLDGRPVQVTDASLNTYPGMHTVALEKPGYQRETREVRVTRGNTADLAVVLSPTAQRAGTPPKSSTIVPLVIVGFGATAIATGIVLYAIDEDPSLNGGKRYRDTASYGVTSGAVGLAAVGVGAFLWFRASRAPSVPSIAAVHDGALITWQGNF